MNIGTFHDPRSFLVVGDVEDAHPQRDHYHQREDATVEVNICGVPVFFSNTVVIHRDYENHFQQPS
jgi:hypothetical protein